MKSSYVIKQAFKEYRQDLERASKVGTPWLYPATGNKFSGFKEGVKLLTLVLSLILAAIFASINITKGLNLDVSLYIMLICSFNVYVISMHLKQRSAALTKFWSGFKDKILPEIESLPSDKKRELKTWIVTQDKVVKSPVIGRIMEQYDNVVVDAGALHEVVRMESILFINKENMKIKALTKYLKKRSEDKTLNTESISKMDKVNFKKDEFWLDCMRENGSVWHRLSMALYAKLRNTGGYYYKELFLGSLAILEVLLIVNAADLISEHGLLSYLAVAFIPSLLLLGMIIRGSYVNEAASVMRWFSTLSEKESQILLSKINRKSKIMDITLYRFTKQVIAKKKPYQLGLSFDDALKLYYRIPSDLIIKDSSSPELLSL